MLYIAWFVILFTLLQLLIAFVNFIFRSKLPKGNLGEKPLVSILIPARDEEKNIGNILNDILHQDYFEIEVIVFNDLSSDRTAEIVKEYALPDSRISLLNSDLLPEGWLGKNWACHTLSEAAIGEYLLFLDADVRVGNGLIANAISYAKHFKLALVSIFPKQIIKTFGEKFTVPNMNYILLSLLPLILVRKSGFSSLAAANGQFMLFDSKIYKTYKLHEKMKSKMVEDIEIARYLKNRKNKIACLVGDSSIQCRMYSSFKEAINGFSKNVSAYFGNSVILATLFWLITTFGFLIVLFELPLLFFSGFMVAFILTRIIISIISKQSIKDGLLFLIPQQMSCGLFIFKAFINNNIKSYQWKGRAIK
jgi:glycosyltransferase involved in cell wall biosynthesis